MEVYKNISHEKVPTHAKVVTKGGKQYARYKQRGGSTVEFLILPNGKMRAESIYWYARILHHGDSIRRPVNLKMSSKTAAVAKAMQLQDDEERKAVGRMTSSQKTVALKPLVGDPSDLPVRKHTRDRNGKVVEYAAKKSENDLLNAISGSFLGDYLEYRGNKFNRDTTLATIRTIRKVCIDTGFKTISDLNDDKLESYLIGLQHVDAERTGKPLSARSIKIRLVAMKAFTRWLIKKKVLKTCPFASIDRIVDSRSGRSRIRREFTDAEFWALVDSAKEGTTIEGVSGQQRSVLYQFARATGIRANEIAQLGVSDLIFGKESWVRLPAVITKNQKYDELPLDPTILERSNIVSVMKAWASSRKPTDPLFDLRTARGKNRKTSKMIKRDAGNAKPVVEYVNGFGFADFHSLRVSFENHLRSLNVDLEVRRSLMRHRDISTTVGYGRVRSGEKASTLSKALQNARENGSRAGESQGESKSA